MAIKINTVYDGDVLEQLLVRATTGNELVSGGHIHIQPNVQKKFAIPRLKAGKMLQKRKEQPVEGDSKGDFNIDEKYLEPKDFMAFTTFNPRAFEQFWRPFQPSGNLVFRELPAEVQNQMLAEMGKVVDFELGYHFINGKYSEAEGNFFDGILTRITADPYVIRVGAGAAITNDNILNVLKLVKTKIPKAIKRNPNLKIFLSDADFDIYDDVLTNKPFKGADYSNMNAERYKGIRMVPLADIPQGVIIAAVTNAGIDSNFWAGVDYVDDAEVIQIDKLTNAGEKYFFKMLMKADTNIVFGEDIVLYDGREESKAANSTDLDDLVLSAGELTPEYDPETLQYSLDVANDVATTTVTATAGEAGQTLKLGAATLTSDEASDAQNLAVGDNFLALTVISANGENTTTYIIKVTRAKP
jgi:hypothetical protein